MKAQTDKPKSLYRVLGIAMLTLIACVAVTLNLVDYFYLVDKAKQSHRDRAVEYSTHLQESLEWPLWNIDDELVQKIGKTFAANPEVAFLDIRDERGRSVYHYGEANGNENRRTVVVEHGDQVVGSLEIGLSQTLAEQQDRQLLLLTLFNAVVLAIALLLVSRWIWGRLLKRPIADMVGVTKDIVAGKYRQIELPRTYVEFQSVISSLKELSEAVASREESLQELNAELTAEIVERKRAEESLREKSGELDLYFTSALDLMCIADTQGYFRKLNPEWERALGYPLDELVGRKFLDLVHPDDIESTLGAISALSAQNPVLAFTNRYRHRDGSYRWLEWRSYPVGTKIYATARDITERIRAEEELRRYKDHLEDEVQQRTGDLILARNAAQAANNAKSTFLASMSHELRTPMNAILGFSSMLRKDARLVDDQREKLDIINRSGEHLLALINDVLEVAKIEAGRVQLDRAAFDLGNMVRDVTDMMQMRAQEKGLMLIVDQASEFPRYITGDEARLRQMLINLVGNAVKFTQEGGVTVRLGTRQNARAHLVIEVQDTGIGISPENQQRIFEPFVQLATSSEQKGTGLGLTITRQFAQLMGGGLSVESVPGEGSTFRLDLPLDLASEGEVARVGSEEHGDIVGLAPDQPLRRILIVEDQMENSMLLSKLMTDIGFPTRTAENGAQALEAFREWKPELIWMDRRMPVMDGIEATHRIRELPGGKDVKIVAVTASAFKEQRDEMLAAGMDDFVRKPYRFNEIYECLARQLGVRYIYANAPQEVPEAPPALLPEKLEALPEALRKELGDALESLESGRIVAVLNRIAEADASLYAMLDHLIARYDYAPILKACGRMEGEDRK